MDLSIRIGLEKISELTCSGKHIIWILPPPFCGCDSKSTPEMYIQQILDLQERGAVGGIGIQSPHHPSSGSDCMCCLG